tara:strand:- start:805 stop:1023 length:219 start_codon:yes stop_codon:yes gene_type:complete
MPLQRTSKSAPPSPRYRIPKIKKKPKKSVSWDPADMLHRARALNLLPSKTSPADVAFAEAIEAIRREFEGRP